MRGYETVYADWLNLFIEGLIGVGILPPESITVINNDKTMRIELTKIIRHKWFPFIVKEIIIEVDGKEQPLCIGWVFKTCGCPEGYEMEVDDIHYDQPLKREWHLTKKRYKTL